MTFDFFTDRRLRDIQKSVEHLRRAASTPNPFAAKQADIETLQQEVGELRLLVAVLYRLLLDQRQFELNDVLAQLSALDASDGKRDGQFCGDAVTGSPQVASEPADDHPFPNIRLS